MDDRKRLTWTVEKFNGVNLGYSGLNRPGRGRKIGGYVVSHPEHLPNGKHCDTQRQVVEYLVEQWDVSEDAAKCVCNKLKERMQ